jgi:hypothetical protein
LAQSRQPAGLGCQRGGQLVPARIAEALVVALVGVGGCRRISATSPSSSSSVWLAALAATLVPSSATRPTRTSPAGGAQLQGLDEEAGKGLLVADAEARDRHVVGELVAGKHPEGEVLVAAPLDLPGGAHTDGVGVQQHAQQRRGVVGGMAVPVGAVGTQERFQVQLVDHVEDEPGEVVAGSQSRRSGGSRKGWSRSPCRKL